MHFVYILSDEQVFYICMVVLFAIALAVVLSVGQSLTIRIKRELRKRKNAKSPPHERLMR